MAASRQRPLAREPDTDCSFCPRLATFRDSLRAAQPEWHNAPVPDFGALDARLLVVGLAPGLRGANRTGRPFTGDSAGDLLYATLIEFGFAAGTYGACIDDGLRLAACVITNAVRCVPPQNKPMPSEIESCRSFLAATIAALPELCAIVALGRIAHESVVRAFGLKPAAFPSRMAPNMSWSQAKRRGIACARAHRRFCSPTVIIAPATTPIPAC